MHSDEREYFEQRDLLNDFPLSVKRRLIRFG
jgi:hypothetical protein